MVESGVLVGGGGLISVPFVDAPVGTPLTLYLALQASASGQVYGDANGLAKVTATGSSAFYETLSFDTSGPAFIMPQGYRADSPTARVENSIFIPEPPPGDYNNDGKVDAADYVVWRKTGGSQAEYDTWRANFGMSLNGAGAGSSLASGATLVPEPGTLWLSWLVLAGTIVFICRRRMALN
jgi:hypothetical protein